MLHDLPQEVGLSILEKLSTRQRARVVLVSSEWQDLVRSNWECICVEKATVSQLRKLFEWLKQIAVHGQQYLQTIEIDSLEGLAWPGKTFHLSVASWTKAAHFIPSSDDELTQSRN